MLGIYIGLNRVLDLVLGPLMGLSPWWPLILVSIVVGVVAMIVFKFASSQSRLKEAKSQLWGHFYEVWLYLDEASVIARSQARLFYHGLRYLGFSLPPLLITIALFFPLFANLETRWAYRPVRPGEEVLVKLRLREPFEGWQSAEMLSLPPGMTQVGYPVRFIRKQMKSEESVVEKKRDYEVDYKLRPLTAGAHLLSFTVRGERFSVPLLAGENYGARASRLAAAEGGAALLYPPVVNLPSSAGVAAVEIKYPKADFPCLGFRVWWVWPFLVISMLAAFAVKGIFKVEI